MPLPILLFDIDKTLFDTASFKKDVDQIVMQICGITKEHYAEIEHEYFSALRNPHDFNPREFCKHIAQRTGKLAKDIQRPYFAESDLYTQHLFSDVLPTLSALQDKYQLGIFSEGLQRFQKTKLMHTSIHRFFRDTLVFISRRKSTQKSLAQLPREATIIDDNLRFIELLQNTGTFHPILLNRKTQEKHATVPTIHTLTDMLEKRVTVDE